MAFKCTKYQKILVGPKKTCDTCESRRLGSECEHRVWQKGVLKEGGRRARAFRREIWPYGIDGLRLFYNLGEDGNYHYVGMKQNRLERNFTEPLDSVNKHIPQTLTPEQMDAIKKNPKNYIKMGDL